MLTNISIGGSNGPTSIFLAGKMNFGWMNVIWADNYSVISYSKYYLQG